MTKISACSKGEADSLLVLEAGLDLEPRSGVGLDALQDDLWGKAGLDHGLAGVPASVGVT